MSATRARTSSNDGWSSSESPLRWIFSSRLSGDFSRDVTLSIGL